jgi:hypothetical protein
MQVNPAPMHKNRRAVHHLDPSAVDAAANVTRGANAAFCGLAGVMLEAAW